MAVDAHLAVAAHGTESRSRRFPLAAGTRTVNQRLRQTAVPAVVYEAQVTAIVHLTLMPLERALAMVTEAGAALVTTVALPLLSLQHVVMPRHWVAHHDRCRPPYRHQPPGTAP